MKKVSIVILFVVLLTGCADNNKTADKPIAEVERKDSIESKLWGAIDIKSWKKTLSINERIATENDVKSGLAVYSVENGGSEHKAYKTQLPKLAYMVDSATKKVEVVVVIQIEITSQGIIAGYRNLNGGNGACFLYELEILDEQMVKQITGD
jgi:hypothetical protein